MILSLKKSRISTWWVATRDDKMNFFNIFSSKHFVADLVVVGYLDNTTELATSTNSIVRVTDDGIITAQGTFYPFEEAHPLYLKFLLRANSPNTVIASYWKIIDQKFHTMIADIVTSAWTQEGITFDFIPDKKSIVMFSGYSHNLSSKVVLSTFRRKGYCSIIGIPNSVISDIAISAIISQDVFIKLVEKVKLLFAEKFEGSYIFVDLP